LDETKLDPVVFREYHVEESKDISTAGSVDYLELQAGKNNPTIQNSVDGTKRKDDKVYRAAYHTYR